MQDVAATTIAYHSDPDSGADPFRFTDQSEIIQATKLTFGQEDKLADSSTTDNDIFKLSLTRSDDAVTVGSTNVGSGSTLSGIETIEIYSDGAKSLAYNGTLTATGLKTLKVGGVYTASASQVTVTVGATNAPDVVDASEVSLGGVSITASAATKAVTLIGGSENDTLTIGAKGGTLTGGAGVDSFDVKAATLGANATSLSAINGAPVVTITDISKGEKITFTNATTVSDKIDLTNSADEGAVWAKLAAIGLSTANGGATTAGSVTANAIFYGTWNGNTYIVANSGTDTLSDDVFVKLVGEVNLADSNISANVLTV